MANDAVEIAGKYNFNLDFTAASTAALEDFCELTYKECNPDWLEELEGKKPRSVDFPAALLGCYLGEVIRKEIGGVWEQEGEMPGRLYRLKVVAIRGTKYGND